MRSNPPPSPRSHSRLLEGSDKYDSKTDFVAKGYQRLLTYQLDSGGIYKDLQANYNTAIAVSSLAAAEDPAFQPFIDRGVAYLKGLQWTPETRPEFVSDKEKFTGKQVVASGERSVLRRMGLWRAMPPRIRPTRSVQRTDGAGRL